MGEQPGAEVTVPEAGPPLTGHILWQLLQISDQLFPTGSYAFSHALETYVELGLVHDRASCQQLLVNLCDNALGPCDMVFCAHAFRQAARQDLQALVDLDRLLQAHKVPQELRLESQHTGQAFLRASLALYPPLFVKTFLQEVQHGTAPGNHAIAFGLVSQSLGLSEEHAVQGYLYNVTAGWVAAALRLIPLGQAEGQRLLHDLAPTLLAVQQRYGHLTPAEAWSCTPGLDIRSMQHERLYTRLFRS
jgi:urease accessory protein